MPRLVPAFVERLDVVYQNRPYFVGVKARLLAAFDWLMVVFVPFNLAKLLWLQPAALECRLALTTCWGLAALLSLRWVRQGRLEAAGNGLVIGMIVPANCAAIVLQRYPEPVAVMFQLFVFNFVMLLMALTFSRRAVAGVLLAIVVATHVLVHERSQESAPLKGSLDYAADTVFRDGMIALGFVFFFGALLAAMINSAHERSEEAFRQTRAANENLERTVSERTRELEAASALAREASRAKSDFLANMSHEIRTPLNGIIATADLLRHRSDLPSEAVEQVRLIADSGDVLLKLIGDILDLSKIEAGRLVLEKHSFALTTLVADVTALLASTAGRASVRFDCTIDAALEGSFSGDSFRLRQVLFNLGSNAVKFTPAGGSVRMVVTGQRNEAGLTHVRFELRDTGIGLTPEATRRIFERFTQADSSTTRRFGGTGLGLSISALIVEAMGGRLAVESVLGEGSVFHFSVPFECLRRDAAPVDNVPVAPAVLNLHVLVAEDNLMNRRILSVQLKQLGCTSVMAVDGVEALRCLQEEPLPDLVLMDCHMPGMDGWEATRQLRAWAHDAQASDLQQRAAVLPVIALTAAALPEERTRCREAGMTDFLSKPAKLADLQGMLVRFAATTSQASVASPASAAPPATTPVRAVG